MSFPVLMLNNSRMELDGEKTYLKKGDIIIIETKPVVSLSVTRLNKDKIYFVQPCGSKDDKMYIGEKYSSFRIPLETVLTLTGIQLEISEQREDKILFKVL